MPAPATTGCSAWVLSDRRPGEVLGRISELPQRYVADAPRLLLSKPLFKVCRGSGRAGGVEELALMLSCTQALAKNPAPMLRPPFSVRLLRHRVPSSMCRMQGRGSAAA